MQSIMTSRFSMVPRAEIQRSTFDRRSGYKTTFNAGYLVPFFCDEVLPGDTFNLRLTAFARLATPIAPYMDNLYYETFFFFVPSRLVWTNFVKMHGEQDNPDDDVDYLVPTVTSPSGGFLTGSVYDYLGLPVNIAGLEVSALPFRAYNLIYKEWFRDENLINSPPINKDDGPDDPGDYVLFRRGKRHDYFTSALPWPQKGPGVELPIGGQAPVYGNGNAMTFDNVVGSPAFGLGITNATSGTAPGLLANIGGGDPATNPQSVSTAIVALHGLYNQPLGSSVVSPLSTYGTNSTYAPINLPTANSGLDSNVYADLSQSTAITINQFRQAFQIQRLYERDARSGGGRYTEVVRAHFNVVSPDARLQRPEYLGGGRSNVTVKQVEQTSATDTTSPQGNLAAFGLLSAHGHGFVRSFTEHGYIIGIMNVRADLNYQQGLDRMWTKRSRFDFYYPALAHLGEQAILNKEIYAQGPSVIGPTGIPADEEVFGYQERHAEYRYGISHITGEFRSQFAQSLDVWHLAQHFTELPTLSQEFIEENPPVERVVAVQDSPHFLFDSVINLKCTRPMPIYGVPGLVDHF